MNTKFICIIPARYASTRFPGKPLAILADKPIIQHVYERACEAVEEVYVATDDERIIEAVESFGGKAIMTRSDHRSGTDRICEALSIIEQAKGNTESANLVVINVQGDEPFIRPEQIKTLCDLFDTPETDIATLVTRFPDTEALFSPNSPKVVTDRRGFALYFSRSVIPYVRGKQAEEWLHSHNYQKHIGIYAYRADVLRQVAQLPASPLEQAESLEQLRWLENGYRIRCGFTETATVGIDTPEDLQHAKELIKKM